MSDITGAGTAVSGVAQAAGSVAAASLQANAANHAADLAASTANRSADLVQQRYDTTRSDLMPYQTVGQAALGGANARLNDFAYTGGDYTSAMSDQNDRLTGIAQSLDGLGAYVPGAQNSAVVPGRMDEATLQQTPGYQFTLDQGLKSTQNSAAARGLGVSGAAMKAAATYATGLADNTYQQQFNQLQTQFGDQLSKDNQGFTQGQTRFGDLTGLEQQQFTQAQQGWTNTYNQGQFDQSGRTAAANRLGTISALGENAAAQTGNAGANAANAAGNYLTAGASGAAAGALASGNAYESGINGVINAYTNYNSANQQNQLMGNNSSYGAVNNAFGGSGNTGIYQNGGGFDGV